MLYRNPEVPPRATLLGRTVRAIAGLGIARRRRLAELDLLALNPHLRRDLGLETQSLPGR